MRRPPRGTARNLSLAGAGALLFVVGYFAGSRYMAEPLQGLSIVLLPEPQPLLPPAGMTPVTHWQLLLVGDINISACRKQLAWLVQTRNRVAQRPELASRLTLLLVVPELSVRPSSSEPPGWRTLAVSRPAAASLADQIGATDEQLDCRGSFPGLLDPQGRLRALLPTDVPASSAAADLERVLDHFHDQD